MDERPDATLVGEALAGDREAFSTLVRRYQDYAYGTAIGMLSDFELGRDVAQEAFLCAYRDLRKLREPERFGGWLRGIVRNTAHRALRELARVRSLAEELGYTAEQSVPPADQAAEEAERREIVQRALGRLNEKNREAVSLHYVNGLSYGDIAEFLGVTEATVQGRLQRARARLRKELKMVAETFKEEELPEDFSAEIKRLLDVAAVRGEEHERAIKRLTEIGAPAVDPLCEALGDPRIPVRRAAGRALCGIGDPRALQPLLRVLYSQYAHAWTGDIFADGRALAIPGMREALLEAVRTAKSEKGQWLAFRALSYAKGDREVFDNFRQVFKDSESYIPRLRSAAMQALCRVAPESAVGVITEALHDPDPRLRRDACWTAIRYALLPPIEACIKAFGRGVGWWGRMCAANLVLSHGEEGRKVLERIMRTGSDAERCTAAVALAREGSEEAFEVLKRELLGVSGDPKWTRAVSRTVARRYGQQLADWVGEDPARLNNIPTVMWTLARSRHAQAGPMVETLSREGTPAVRAAAVRILARQRGAEYLPELRRCLRAGRPRKVAQEAFWQMLRLGDAGVPTAEEMFRSDNWTERRAAACLLRRWGKLTPEQKAQGENDPHIAVRHAANWHPDWVRASGWHAKWGKRVGNRHAE